MLQQKKLDWIYLGAHSSEPLPACNTPPPALPVTGHSCFQFCLTDKFPPSQAWKLAANLTCTGVAKKKIFRAEFGTSKKLLLATCST